MRATRRSFLVGSSAGVVGAAFAPPQAVAAGDEVKFISAGKPLDICEQGKTWRGAYRPWREANGFLEGIGDADSFHQSKQLVAGKAVGASDFHVKAALSIVNLKGGEASFVINNNSHFIFSPREDCRYQNPSLALSGPFFGAQPVQLGEAAIREGKLFRFEAIRKGDDLRFLIDGKQVHQMRYSAGPLGAIGFRPWWSNLRIQEFSASGESIGLAKFYSQAPEQQALWISGQDGYVNCKIPSLLVSAKGTVLAFCEGRHRFSDSADTEIVVRRSPDSGKTWTKQQVVWDDGTHTCGNPCPVVDRETGAVWMLMCRDNDKVFASSSADDGVTWSGAVEITASTKHKNWSWYATGPGSGIQLQRGKHKGRLVIPSDHRSSEYGMGSHAIYSDDHGGTWKTGAAIKPGVNECQVVELSDGALMMNMRSYHRKGCRAVATSGDGGETWSDISHATDLSEPVCQASILRYSGAPDKNRILFSNPAWEERVRLTVRMSYDDGKTWPVSRLLYSGPSGYSNLAVLPDGSVGCLHEAGLHHWNEDVVFARFSLDWLTHGRDKA